MGLWHPGIWPQVHSLLLTYLPGICGSAEARARRSGSSVRNACPAVYTTVLRFSVGEFSLSSLWDLLTLDWHVQSGTLYDFWAHNLVSHTPLDLAELKLDSGNKSLVK